MKNLRQLIRRYTNQPPVTPRRSSKTRRGDGKPRRLSSEALERRELLAAGVLEMHNPLNQFDVNNDYEITARDALSVINYLGRGESEQAGDDGDRMFYDVNGDNEITAADALGVINAIGRGEANETALIELLLTARETGVAPGGEDDDFNLDLIAPDSNGVTTVEVGKPFDIEVSYVDRRIFSDERLGAFQLIVDLATSNPDVITPVLYETQQLIVDEAIRDIPSSERVNTTATISIPNAPPGITGGSLTYEASFNELAVFSVAVTNALESFGYTDDQFRLETPSQIGDDFGVRIIWTDPVFADVDLPDLDIEINEPDGIANIETETDAIAPVITVGGEEQFNPAAIPFNINTFSRTFKQSSNNPFGEQFYNSNNAGEFDPDTGFSAVRGIGGIPSQGGGIPQLIPAPTYPAGPFDAFAFTVVINEPVTNFQIDLSPNADQGDDTEAILIYGEDDRIPISNEVVIIERPGDPDVDNNGNASLVINAVVLGGNQAPEVSSAITRTVTEDDGTIQVDLLQFASDPDGDTLSVTDDAISGDPQNAASISGTTLSVDTGAYNALNNGDSNVITVNYNVNDGNGGTVAQTATITINGVTDPVNQAPEVSSAITRTATEDDGTIQVDLLQFASDPDGDTLSVTDDSISGDPQSAASISGTTLSVNTGAYNALNNGDSNVIAVSYNVNDGNGGTAAQTATITINGVTDPVNQAPEVSSAITRSAGERDADFTVDLLQFASDPDGDTLNVANVDVSDEPPGAVSVDGNSLDVVPILYADLNDGETDVITVSYDIVDGNGGSVSQTATITINGVTDLDNEPPTVSGPIVRTVSEDDGTITVDLLQFSSDPDDDQLSVIDEVISGDPQNSASIDGNTLSVNTDAYTALNDGDSNIITVAYRLTDGDGGRVDQTATITITGVTDVVNTPPTVTPITRNFTEGAANGNIGLLGTASDADGDSLSISTPQLTQGNDVGITISGTNVTVNPRLYSYLVPGDSEVVRYTYTVSDGVNPAVPTSATITINGATDDPPTTGNVPDASVRKDGDPISIDVLANASAGGGESQTLSIISAALADPTAGTVSTNGTLTFTPAPGFTGSTQINYVISDGTSQVGGSVNVAVTDFQPSSIGGAVFIDRIENMRDVIGGATPLRDGMKDDNEQAFAGVEIRLRGNGMEFVAITDTDGRYEFSNVEPGDYEIIYNAPSNVIYDGPSSMSISIGADGGMNESNMNIPLLGLAPGATTAVDILARTYLNSAVEVQASSNNGREGAVVSLDSSGSANFILAGEGFEDVKFADVRAINGSDSDMALLMVMKDDGEVLHTIVSRDRAVASPDGSTMRFFGGMDDFNFQSIGDSGDSYDDFRDAIDQILTER